MIANGASLVTLCDDLAVARRSASRIGVNAQRLSQMIGELIDALTDHSGPEVTLHLCEFDIHSLIMAACEELNESGLGRFEAAGESIKGHWCNVSMRRALDNLAGNAGKYGDGALACLT